MKKIRLLTPGPTPVPERLSLRMAQPIVHHRSPEFEQVFARCREGLSWLFQTKQDVVQLAASWTLLARVTDWPATEKVVVTWTVLVPVAAEVIVTVQDGAAPV